MENDHECDLTGLDVEVHILAYIIWLSLYPTLLRQRIFLKHNVYHEEIFGTKNIKVTARVAQ